MEVPLEDSLYKAVQEDNLEEVRNLLTQGANPNKATSYGKTSLGVAAYNSNLHIIKILIDHTTTVTSPTSCPQRKRNLRSHKRRLRLDSYDPHSKSKNLRLPLRTEETNRGYYVFVHDDNSSPELVSSISSPMSSSSSPELEWDEEVGNTAASTSEDETWTSLYKWYAAMLECAGAALACAATMPTGLNQQDGFLRTALHYAAEQGHVGVIKMLLDAGCQIDISAGDSLTPLHVAVVRNHEEATKMLLDAGSQVNYKTNEKMTALHFAATRGYLGMVEILVKAGALLEARDTSERSPLYLAAARGHVDVVAYLIAAGANIYRQEIHGYTPLCEAVWQRNVSTVRLLLASGARIIHSHRLLHNAVLQKQVEIVELLAAAGGGVNIHDDNGDTPLLLAGRTAQAKVARILLQHGANVNSIDNITGVTTLHTAVASVDSPKDFEELLLCLLEYNIDMNAQSLTGDTALNRAILLNRDHAVCLLVRYGADVNACDLHACALDNLTLASTRQTPEIVRLLIKAGHFIPPPESNKKTAEKLKPGSATHWLHYACREPLNLTDLCRLIIRRNCKNMLLHKYIASLPLPVMLKRFLMLEDEGY